MNRKSISPGPGAASLILVVVIVSMSVLCMLSLYSTSGECNLAYRAAEVVQQTYTLSEMADKTAQDAAEAGQEGSFEWTESNGKAVLYCAIEIKNGEYTFVRHELEIMGADE